MADQFGDTEISDQKLKVWLEERIVRLAVYRYELSVIQEQIDAIDQYADYLKNKGQPLPLGEKQQRAVLAQDYHSKFDEMRAAFEPTASHPFTPREEMKIYCQTFVEVNERIKRAAQTVQPEQETARAYQEMNAKAEALRNFLDEWNQIEQRLDRFQAIEVKRSLTEKETVEYQRTQAQEKALWNYIEVAFPEYQARGQPYIDIDEMQEDLRRYRRAADSMGSYLKGIIHLHHLQERLEELGVEYPPAQVGQAQKALTQLQELREDRRASSQPSQQQPPPPKRSLRDLYGTADEEEQPPGEPRDEPGRSR